MARLLFSELICVAYLLYFPGVSGNSERGLSFNFPEFTESETDRISLVGDAGVSYNVVYLTNSSNLPSSGRIVYNETIQALSIANFSTHFVFSMYSDTEDSQGDGIAFFLTYVGYAYAIPQFKSQGLFGLAGDRLDVIPAVFAVAFDSRRNIVGTIGRDFSDYHYLQNASVSDLHKGRVWDAWIDYNSQTQILDVYLASGSQSSKSPQNCILSQNVNLSALLRGNIVMGFSSAAVNSNETHRIFSWSFNSIFYPKNPSAGFSGSANGSEMSSKGKDRKQIRTFVKIFLGVGSGIVVCIALWGYCIFRRKRGASIKGQKLADKDLDKLLCHIPRRFKLDDLIAGTNNFREAQKLGQGGFGGVYKCNLVETNEIVAVKRISEGSRQGIKEFISEVSIVSRLRHRNLLQLLGWCQERDQLLLVYEYMPNGSLDRHIFIRGGEEETTSAEEEEEPQVLRWSIRYKIANEIASALLYLHEEWDECVLHRDVKSSNILLDSNFSAKLGDFGIARMVRHERLAQTTRAAGTLGYLAPECVASGKTSRESDVYSFGAVALEIASGKKAIDESLVEFDMRVVAWAWDLYGQGRLLEGADVKLNGGFVKEEMERLMVVGLWCSHPDAASRPKMRQVMRLLNFEIAAPALPPTMPVPSYAHTSFTTGPSFSVVSQSLPNTLSPR